MHLGSDATHPNPLDCITICGNVSRTPCHSFRYCNGINSPSRCSLCATGKRASEPCTSGSPTGKPHVFKDKDSCVFCSEPAAYSCMALVTDDDEEPVRRPCNKRRCWKCHEKGLETDCQEEFGVKAHRWAGKEISVRELLGQ